MRICTRCSAYKNEYNINCMSGFGPKNTTYMFIGEMYGKQECLDKEPFVGQAGKVLINLLEMIGLEKKDVFITNVCRCYIKDNKTPSKKILDACFVHTNREIRKVNPKLVIALGASAFYSLTGRTDFKWCRGKLIYSKKIKRKVYTMYHPAAGLHNPNLRDQIKEDFLKIPEMVDAKPFKRKNYPYVLVDTDDKFNFMYEELVGNILGLDLETTELDMYNPNNYIRTIQIGKIGRIFVIVPEIFNKHKNTLRDLLEKSQIIGQDFAFDAKWLAVKLNIYLKREWYFDVCLAEFVLTGMKNNDLDYTTAKYNPDYYGYWEDVQKVGGAHLIQDKKELYQYGANDVGTLFVIAKKQEKLLHMNNQHWLFKNITMPCNKILTEMSLRGIKLDIYTIYKTDEKYKLRAQKALMRAKVLPGIAECEYHFGQKFNPKSSDMIKWLLLDYYKLPILKETKKGNPSIQHKEMKTYAEKYDNKYCQIMEHYRSVEAIRKNFLSGVIPKLVDGVAHTTYSLHATGSGRPNSRGINLLNIPREKAIKRCYIPFDGYTFVYSDFSTMEIRVAAMLSGDKNLIRLCNDKSKEFHSSVACEIDGIDYDYFEKKRKEEGEYGKYDNLRTDAKRVSFGVLYQMSKESLALLLGCSIGRAEEIIYNYFVKFPRLQEYIEEIKQHVIRYGYVDNFFGFRRSWKYHSEEDTQTLREAVNHPIQSTAVFLMYLSMIEIDKKLKENKMDSFLSLQVYDSIVCQSVEDEINDTASIMHNVMENINKPYDELNKVQLIADIMTGCNLGDVEKYEIC